MDLGRIPFARFPSGDFALSEDVVTFEDIGYAVSQVSTGSGTRKLFGYGYPGKPCLLSATTVCAHSVLYRIRLWAGIATASVILVPNPF